MHLREHVLRIRPPVRLAVYQLFCEHGTKKKLLLLYCNLMTVLRAHSGVHKVGVLLKNRIIGVLFKNRIINLYIYFIHLL